MIGRKTDNKLLRSLISVGAILLASIPILSIARPAEVRIVELRELRFGQFAVIGSGRRTIDVDGSISDRGLISTGPSSTGPALFEVSYDRGHDAHSPISLVVELAIDSDHLAVHGVGANVTDFTSDIPGSQSVQPGRPFFLEIYNCRTRICRARFKIGATLRLEQTSSGTEISVPTTIWARVSDIY